MTTAGKPSRCCALVVLVLGTSPARGQSELRLDDVVSRFTGTVEVPLTLSTPLVVEGFVAVFEVDTASLRLVDVMPAPGLTPGDGRGENADTVVIDFADDHAVVGAVLNSNPRDNFGKPESLGPGEELLLATPVLECGGQPADTDEVTAEVAFVNGRFGTGGGPPLDNLLVVGGRSIGVGEGLELTAGSVRCVGLPDRLMIESAVADVALTPCGVVADAVPVRILMNSSEEVEAFVTSVCHDPGALVFEEAKPGTAAGNADFASFEQRSDGAALGVILDISAPLGQPPPIPPGQNLHIASFMYRCLEDADGVFRDETPLRFCDGIIGDPPKDNIIVVGGLSIGRMEGLELDDGAFRCLVTKEFLPEMACEDGVDNDCDGLTDAADPDCTLFFFELVDPETGVLPIEAPSGRPVRGLLTFRSPLRRDLGLAGPDDPALASVQGFSLGYEFACEELSFEETFETTGSALEAVDAEFVAVQADNEAEPVDGDGCSLVVAVLVDAAPPFDGATLPALEEAQSLGLLELTVREGVPCGAELSASARDGVDGRGDVPVRNLISVENRPFRARVREMRIVAGGVESFFRGDCNFSRRLDGRDPVQVSDAAAVVSSIFLEQARRFEPPCLDACDADDDGRIDLADAVAILNYLFAAGSDSLPAPGAGFDRDFRRTGPGVDPTPDPLDCGAALDCAPAR